MEWGIIFLIPLVIVVIVMVTKYKKRKVKRNLLVDWGIVLIIDVVFIIFCLIMQTISPKDVPKSYDDNTPLSINGQTIEKYLDYKDITVPFDTKGKAIFDVRTISSAKVYVKNLPELADEDLNYKIHKLSRTHYQVIMKQSNSGSTIRMPDLKVKSPLHKTNGIEIRTGTNKELNKLDAQSAKGANDEINDYNENSSAYDIRDNLPKKIKNQLSADEDPASIGNPSVHLKGSFSSKPYVMNVILNDDKYRNPNDSYTSFLSMLKAIKKFDVKDFSNIKLTISTPLVNSYGNNLGYQPVDWYSFNPTDIQKMNPDNMNKSALDVLTTEHSNRNLRN